MRILITTSQGNISGATYSIGYLAKGLAERGHEIHVACRREVLLVKLLSGVANVHFHFLEFKGYFDIPTVRKLKKLITHHAIELVNSQSGVDRTLALSVRLFFNLKVKLVFTRRQRPRNEPWMKIKLHLLGTDRIVLVSFGLKELFIQKGYPARSLEVIHNGIPMDEWINLPEMTSAYRKKYNFTGKVVGCVSRLKKQDVLIRAMKYLPADYNVLFVGIERSEVQQILDQEKPEQRIEFTGLIEHQQVKNLYGLMDIAILPTHMDGFGLTLVEAMLAHIPVIGSNFGGVPDIIDPGVTGFLFDNDHPQELAEKIQRVLNDFGCKTQMVNAAYNKVTTKFDISNTIDSYEALFQSLILPTTSA